MGYYFGLVIAVSVFIILFEKRSSKAFLAGFIVLILCFKLLIDSWLFAFLCTFLCGYLLTNLWITRKSYDSLSFKKVKNEDGYKQLFVLIFLGIPYVAKGLFDALRREDETGPSEYE